MQSQKANGTKDGVPPRMLQQAFDAHQSGQLDRAFNLYKRFLETNPGHPTALQLLGLLYSQQGNYDAAITLMRESLRMFPNQPEVLNNLGNAYSRDGRLAEAIECYLQALEQYPEYAEAFRNLGLCYMKLEDYARARVALLRAIDLEPDHPETWLSLGSTHQDESNYAEALRCYQKALDLKPDYAAAHHNVGLCKRMMRQPKEAVAHYDKALSLGLDIGELQHNLGNARVDLRDIPGAIDAYRKSVAHDPGRIESHRNLNSLLWQQGLADEYLKSYENALRLDPAATELRLAWAISLTHQDDFEQATRVLEEGLRRVPDSSELMSMLAYSFEGQGMWDEALEAHEKAIKLENSVPNHRVSYARALLARQRPDEALVHAESAARDIPKDQRALAYLGLCWRLLGDERDAYLNDYEKLVRPFELPVPEGYASAGEFNERLVAALQPMHIDKRHPPEQTLRGGSQTYGDLFDLAEPEIQALVGSLRECIREYIGSFPITPRHPLYSRRSTGFDFSASWSVRLARCGFHTMHTHPMGWISSAYYVQVPKEVSETDTHGGGIKFGEPDIDLGEAGNARRIIQPTTGQLVLFPSYMWHGTIPFESDDPRMTVAFDVVPTSK